MTDAPDDNVVKLEPVRKAFDNAKPHDKAAAAARSAKRSSKPKDGGGSSPPKDPPPPWRPPPSRLPADSPVKALGYNGLDYHVLAKSGQRITLAAKEISRNNILAVFGGEEYLVENWPGYNKDGEPTGEFKHGRLSPVIISTCQDVGLWDPAEKERGVGCWAEEDAGKSVLVFHCGDILVTNDGERSARTGTGLRGRLLYPSAPALPEPILKTKQSRGAADASPAWGPQTWAELEGPGARVMEKLVTWNFARPMVDAMLLLGWLGAALLGAAPVWRPMLLITGDSRTGKSTLLKLLKWVLGTEAFVSSGNATQAAIARKVKNSSKPVILDELERSQDNDRVEKLIELMVLSSSGETLDRGTPGTETNSFMSRNCFAISAIAPPQLRPQDLNRLFMVELEPLEGYTPSERDEDEDDDETGRSDPVLGDQETLEKVGRELRGRLLAGWHRYHKTLRAYCKALRAQKHDRRGADQFGAALVAYDLIMFDAFDQGRIDRLAAFLPAKSMSETSGTVSNHEACLQHLLSSTPMLIRGGANETVAHWLRQAKASVRAGKDEEYDDALRALAKTGLKLFRDKRYPRSDNEVPHWTVAISNEADGLARIFANTKWSKSSGATAGWPQMFKRLPGAETALPSGGRLRIYIDGWRHYVTYVPLNVVLPEFDPTIDTTELATVPIEERRG